MQILEALISLLVFLSIVQLILYIPNLQLDTSLYKYYQVNDIYRVLYLNEDFYNLSFNSSNAARDKAEADLKIIGSLTGNCYFIRGIDITNCRNITSSQIISTQKILIVGQDPAVVTFSIERKE